MDKEILLVLAGGLISLVSSLLTSKFNHYLDNSGEIKAYSRIVHSIEGNPFGVTRSSDGHLFMRLPMWIDLFNTSNKNRYIRDFNVIAVDKNNKEIASFAQIQGKNLHTDNQYDYGNNQMYSFVVSPHSVKRYTCLFTIREDDDQLCNKQISCLKVRYYDEKDKQIVRELYKFNTSDIWKVQSFDHKSEWLKI